MTSRDDQQAAYGRTSRARQIILRAQDFHRGVLATAAEASSGKTSPPSPARSSAATRRSRTGVTEDLDQQGWTRGVSLPHLCLPPQRYPEGCGPGSQWQCRCGAVWVADGLAWDDYPTSPSRREGQFNPERWLYQGGGQLTPEQYEQQAGYYDWRPLGPYYVKLYRAMLDALQGNPSEDWRDMP